MADWQKDWWKVLETSVEEMEKFFQDLGASMEFFAEEVSETVEACAEQLQEVVVTEIDWLVQDFFDLFEETDIELEIYRGEFDSFTEESDWVGFYQQPSREQNAACIGCRHYHGQVYGGNLLVCAMHPYGWEEENCPDWEAYSDRLN